MVVACPLLGGSGVRTYGCRPRIIWHLLSDPQARFADLGPGFYDSRISNSRKMRNHIGQLEALGYKVTVEPAA